jgi:formate C-acetyltransferase
MQSLQLNCTSKEELLDAQAHPENYPDLIVRVTGFSAKFTSLSRAWQDEVISRNFYE